MNRRGFLGTILAACAAPAIVRADSLMRIIPVETKVLAPVFATGSAAITGGTVLLDAVWSVSSDGQYWEEALISAEGCVIVPAGYKHIRSPVFPMNTPGGTYTLTAKLQSRNC